ncbi:MAG: 2-oxoacid:ferredoxin oxidoreductase subunit beta [Pseudomonadota bacterium]
MSYITPRFRHPDLTVNSIGRAKKDYEGVISTLCAGCGHDSVSAAVVQACYELEIEPHRVAKLSGIGCSSKTPAYFLKQSHGFNSVHGRMPSVATGANLANRDLIYLGVSGDGDTASIGMGQFVHVMRRNLNMLYLVENNGCYGLTKGQDSATADVGSKTRGGSENTFEPVDLVSLALNLGATFVARSFSGDKAQLVPLLKAGLSHRGFALIDVISPCVSFNNAPGSTKSYDYVREHVEAMDAVDFVPEEKEITAEYAPGESIDIKMHSGDSLRLSKLLGHHDPRDRKAALDAVAKAKDRKEILTGLIYIDTTPPDLHDMLNTTETPLRDLDEKKLCPGSKALEKINAELR